MTDETVIFIGFEIEDTDGKRRMLTKEEMDAVLDGASAWLANVNDDVQLVTYEATIYNRVRDNLKD